jgi:HPt (histidine-containing phosphotransfer) domain-containing protein
MPASTDPPRPPVDPAVLDRLAADLGDLGDIVDVYVRALPRRCGEIAQALADGDAEGVSRGAHTLRSASAFLGAVDVVELCDRLEREARAGFVVTDRGRELTDACRSAERELRALTRRADAPER